MSRTADNLFLIKDRLPFSHPGSISSIIPIAQELLKVLQFEKKIGIVEGSVDYGFELERRFRLSWWSTGSEPLRYSLSQLKRLIFRESRTEELNRYLTKTWQPINALVNSSAWRHSLASHLKKTRPNDKEFLRLFFRAAQQVWTRAARWQAVMPGDVKSPFIPMIKLMAAGAWPLGCDRDTLWIFCWGKNPVEKRQDIIIEQVKPDPVDQKDYVFLSALFRDSELISRWEKTFKEKGFATLHGPVDEEMEPAEVQLGRQIRAAKAVVGILPEVDPDFGIPWWMYQELDYSRYCHRPVALISNRKMPQSQFKQIRLFHLPSINRAKSYSTRKLWEWLEKERNLQEGCR